MSDDLPVCDCGYYRDVCGCPEPPPERAILADLIAELYGYADSGVDSGWAPLYSVIDRAEARLRQITEKVTGDE